MNIGCLRDRAVEKVNRAINIGMRMDTKIVVIIIKLKHGRTCLIYASTTGVTSIGGAVVEKDMADSLHRAQLDGSWGAASGKTTMALELGRLNDEPSIPAREAANGLVHHESVSERQSVTDQYGKGRFETMGSDVALALVSTPGPLGLLRIDARDETMCEKPALVSFDFGGADRNAKVDSRIRQVLIRLQWIPIRGKVRHQASPWNTHACALYGGRVDGTGARWRKSSEDVSFIHPLDAVPAQARRKGPAHHRTAPHGVQSERAPHTLRRPGRECRS
jgi:hypothetical protein